MSDPWITVPLAGLVVVLCVGLLRRARRHDLHIEIDWHSTDRVGRHEEPPDASPDER